MAGRIVALVAFVAAIAVSMGGAVAAPVPGVYLSSEGQWGFRLTPPFAPFVTAPYPQLTPTDEYTGWEIPNFAIVAPLSSRIEVGAVLGGGAGLYVRLGTVASAWGGFRHFDEDSWANATCGPPWPGTPECEFNTCITSIDPCAHYEAMMVRGYAEVAPRVVVGFAGPGVSIGWGLQPFAGQFVEHFASRYDRLNSSQWKEVEGFLAGEVRGILGILESEVQLSDRARLLLSAGGGAYRGVAAGAFAGRAANTATDDPDDFTGKGFDVATAFSGIRGQFGVGFAYDVASQVSLGLMGRADYWSAFPGLTVPSPGNAHCEVRDNGDPVCEPPKMVGEFGVGVAPTIHFTAGVTLTLRLGP